MEIKYLAVALAALAMATPACARGTHSSKSAQDNWSSSARRGSSVHTNEDEEYLRRSRRVHSPVKIVRPN
jgi:hypothetical protein